MNFPSMYPPMDHLPVMPPQTPMQGEGMNQGSDDPTMSQGPNYISQQDHVDEREEAYEQAFKDQAYNVFSSKHPQLVPSIVTFKVIKSSIESGDAFGAFILNLSGETLYVPIIMSDNMLKPIDIFYSKRMDMFLPFNREWMQVVMSSNHESLGEGVKPHELLQTDKDISKLVFPPLFGSGLMSTGIINYAEERPRGMNFPKELDHLELVKKASNDAKKTYKELLQGNKSFLKFAAEHYPTEKIQAALTPTIEKVAAVPIELATVSLDDPAPVIKETFGPDTNKAMEDIARDGFAYKDTRQNLGSVLSATESKIALEEPQTNGVYQVYMSDGRITPALVFVNPEELYNHGPMSIDGSTYGYANAPEETKHDTWTYGDHRPRKTKLKHFMVILPDGDYFYTHTLVASPCDPKEFSGNAVFDQLSGKKTTTTVSGSNVCFVKVEGNLISATKAHFIDKTEIAPDGFRRYVKNDPFAPADGKVYGERKKKPQVECEFLHAPTRTGKVMHPTNSQICVIPPTYRVVKLGDQITNPAYLRTPEEVLDFAQRKAIGAENRTVKIANVGAGEFTIDGRFVGHLKEASFKFAKDYNVAMATSVKCFKKLAFQGDYEKLIVVPHEKNASIFSTGNDGTEMSPEAVQEMHGIGKQAEPSMMQGQMQPSVERPNTQLMQIGAQTHDPELYNVGVLNSLSHHQDIRELLSVYSSSLEKSLDNVGRMLLTFWIKGRQAREDLGEETYYETEESLRTVFRELGGLLIKLNQRAAATPDQTAL